MNLIIQTFYISVLVYFDIIFYHINEKGHPY